MGLSLRAFGKVVNASDASVRRAVKSGRLRRAVLSDGTIDERVGVREWVENADPRTPIGGNPPGARSVDPNAAVASASRAAAEAFKAKLLEIEYKRAIGELIPVADMNDAIFETARRVRDRLQSIPARLAPVVAGLAGDREECYKAIDTEVNLALDELAGMQPTLSKKRRGAA